MTPRPVIVQPENGTDLYAFGEVMALLLRGEQSGGSLTVLFDLTPVGGGTPPHLHHYQDELYLPVDGRLSFLVNERWTEVEAGGLVYLPRNHPHAYRNVGTTPAHHWLISLPAGLEAFYQACAAEFARLGGPDEARLLELHHAYGLELIATLESKDQEQKN